MTVVLKILTTACCLSAVLIFTGCQPEASTGEKEADHGHGHEHGHEHGHDHHHSDRPESLRAAIVELKELSDSFCSAMEKDDTEAAHDPLHDLGKLLEAMPELAADTDLPEEEWNLVKDEIDRLFDAFGEVDSAFHKKDGDKKAAYEDAKSTIEAGVVALEAKLPLLGDDKAHADHEHDHDHDHDGESHEHEHEHDEDSHEHESHEHEHDEESHEHEHEHDEDSHDDE